MFATVWHILNKHRPGTMLLFGSINNKTPSGGLSECRIRVCLLTYYLMETCVHDFANRVDPDKRAPIGALSSASALFDLMWMSIQLLVQYQLFFFKKNICQYLKSPINIYDGKIFFYIFITKIVNQMTPRHVGSLWI